MGEWITRLRAKPKRIKDQYAFLGATIATGVIALVWVVSFPTNYQLSVEDQENYEDTSGAFSQFVGGIKQQAAAVLGTFNTLQEDTTVPDTTPEAAPAITPGIVIPELTPAEINTINPKPILIATTSSASATRSE